MRAGWVAGIALLVCVPTAALSQPPTILPPVAPAPDETPALPNGKPVSRPLTPVEVPPATAEPAVLPDQTAEPVQRVAEIREPKRVRRGPLGPAWDSMELLLWWPKAQPLPPLVAATRGGSPPSLGNPATTVLVGTRAIDNQDVAGGRFVFGWALNDAETVGLELGYFFLGSRTLKATYTSVGNPRIHALGLPFINALTGREDVFATAAPGSSAGSVYSTTTTRVQGAEANVVGNLIDEKCARVNAIIGYRFLQVHEGVTVEQLRFAAGGYGPIYDEFVGHNRFHGAQLGLHADLSRGIVFCELTGKVALGRTFEMVRIDGATGVRTLGPTGLIDTALPGGVFAVPSNIGRYTHGEFAVVPEGIFKIGLKLSDVGRFYVGYNFLYLSEAVRPGDQIDRVINPSQIAALNPGGAFTGSDRPRPVLKGTDFWVQGLIIGLETRY